MATQLRVFTITPRGMDDFLAAWTAGVYPLRLAHGYRIEHAWVDRAGDRFYWVLSYDGPESWEAKEAAYYGSAGRAAVDPDPRRYIVRSEHVFVEPWPLPPSAG